MFADSRDSKSQLDHQFASTALVVGRLELGRDLEAFEHFAVAVEESERRHDVGAAADAEAGRHKAARLISAASAAAPAAVALGEVNVLRVFERDRDCLEQVDLVSAWMVEIKSDDIRAIFEVS